MTDIAGRVAVVTGGGSGIGRGLARALARAGAKVAVADILLESAEKTAALIREERGAAIAVGCDVCERASLRELEQRVSAELGRASLIFANAGATSFTRLVDMSDDDVDWIIEVNLKGTLNTLRAFLPGMIAAGQGGHLVATASMAGLLPGWLPIHAPYSAAKAGIIGLMLNLAMELQPHCIGTTSYCPGAVASGMKDNNGRYRPERFGGPEPVAAVQFAGGDTKHSDLRFYHPDDVAPMVLAAVENNRPFVFDHADQRPLFRSTYADVVEACYDDIDAWERDHGVPKGNPDGAALKE